MFKSTDLRHHDAEAGAARGNTLPSHQAHAKQPPIERFALGTDKRTLTRSIQLRNGDRFTTVFRLEAPARRRRPSQDQLAALWDRYYLRSNQWPADKQQAHSVRVVDLFSGCGLMTLGAWEACRAIGRWADPILAADIDCTAGAVYKSNFDSVLFTAEPVENLLDGKSGSPASITERKLKSIVGSVDLLLGGPPCQGHSNLNNHTRRDDPKNRLYERMSRFAELVRPTHVIIENVPQVLRDRGRILAQTVRSLETRGYSVDHCTIDVVTLGVPQCRRRHVLVASLENKVDIATMLAPYRRQERSVGWILGDLLKSRRLREFDRPSRPSTTNIERIDFLFANNLYDLPNDRRPDCHRLKAHTYKSVYGRMRWDEPSQTITTGFLSMGQGRFVHPIRRRTLTPHEAARLQFIPDFFSFEGIYNRTRIAQMIGNAVPPKLVYALTLELFR